MNSSLLLLTIPSQCRCLYLDCPSAVKVIPSGGPYKAGDVLTCMSDGHPEPSYTWTDSDGDVVSTARRITLSEGPFNLTCTATGNFNTPCSASGTISGNATGKTPQFVVCSVTSVSLSSLHHAELAPVSYNLLFCSRWIRINKRNDAFLEN